MHYVYAITTPASTTFANRQKTILALSRGRITRVDVQFPSGLQGLAYLVINRGLNQLFPTNPDGYYASSAETIWWPEDYDLSTDPFQLEAYTWNLDVVYQHTITVRVTLEPVTPGASLWETARQILGLQSGVPSA